MRYKGWIVVACIAVVMVGIVCGVLIKRCGPKDTEVLPMEETMASIEEVRPRGDIYVCSAMIEDYTTKRATEKNFILPDEEHSCVQTMRQKCSYKIDLDKVEYSMDEERGVVYVTLPDLEYVASTQSSSFLSDDSEYWVKHLPNTNTMKRTVEELIKQRFDTPGNRRKAERYAEDAISNVMERIGYQTEFVRKIERASDLS